MSNILCLSGDVLLKAGALCNINFQGVSGETMLSGLIAQATANVSLATRNDWLNYASGGNTNGLTLNSNVTPILNEAISNLAGMYVISYDMSNYTTKLEAESMLDVLRDSYERCLRYLIDWKNIDFLTGA